jgi:hypothetical protein
MARGVGLDLGIVKGDGPSPAEPTHEHSSANRALSGTAGACFS